MCGKLRVKCNALPTCGCRGMFWSTRSSQTDALHGRVRIGRSLARGRSALDIGCSSPACRRRLQRLNLISCFATFVCRSVQQRTVVFFCTEEASLLLCFAVLLAFFFVFCYRVHLSLGIHAQRSKTRCLPLSHISGTDLTSSFVSPKNTGQA